LVTEGRVAVEKDSVVAGVDAPAPSAERLATLEAGTRVVVELSAEKAVSSVVIPVPSPEIEERLAWRIPRLDFSATPLAEVLPMFNRHGRMRITLEDPSLGDLLITGVLREDNPDSLLELLEIAFRVKAERRSDSEVVLRR
jgi:ferric-dicitrate binding protein FerR (iron transport regulator)